MLFRVTARDIYDASDLALLPLTFDRMVTLRNIINREMLKDALMDGTFHMRHRSTIRVHSENCAELRCEAHYFDDREAVTFNANGFVGFAGWADDQNVQPILRGFVKWVKFERAVAEENEAKGEELT